MSNQPNLKGKPAQNIIALHHLPGKLLSDEDLECQHWYEAFPKWPEKSNHGPRATLTQWSELSQNALASASRMYERQMATSSGDPMKKAFEKEKTIGDKIAAVTLLVQESPVHRLDELRTLLSFAQKKGRRERAPAIDAIKDLLLNDLLPNNRRLAFFRDRHFLCAKGKLSKRHIIYAMYESELKSIYREFLQVLEESGRDTLPFFKQKTVKVICELLVAKPENENALLTMLVNKLGDPDRKVSSTASYSLLQLIEKHHPQMRSLVVKEVEQLLNRPHISPRTRYYSVCFLNQISFKDDDVDLARKFVRIYMDLFTVCLEEERKAQREPKDPRVKKKRKRIAKRKRLRGEDKKAPKSAVEAKETKLMGALLVGVNRAFPYTKSEQDSSSYEEYYDSLFYVAHAKSLGPSTHALAFLFQISQSNSTQNDRFYQALYSRIYDVADSSEMTQAAFLNLVYKAMKTDTNTRRLKAFMKRLLQASCQSTPGFAGACIMVISETFATGERGVLKSFVSLPEKDDQDEDFRDIDDFPDNDSPTRESSSKEEKHNAINLTKNSLSKGAEQTEQLRLGVHSSLPRANPGGYDPTKRDPQYADADRSSLWEAVTLTSHYHPSLSLFAKTICGDMKPVSYASDPLKDFSQIAFLDRFSYKKAKNRVAKSLYGKRSVRYRDGPLANSEQFQELIRIGNVAHDDIFLARFFSTNPDRVQCGTDNAAHFRESHGSDVDSEEDAFEKALEVEMRQLGSDEGNAVNGVNDFVGDIDKADEDEIRAFEKAFANEMVESEDEGDHEFNNKETSPMRIINGNLKGEDSEEDSQHLEVSQEVHNPLEPFHSPFAAAEDYAAAIENDMSRTKGDPNSDVTCAFEPKQKQKRIGELKQLDQTDSQSVSADEDENEENEEEERLGVNNLPTLSRSKRPSKRRRITSDKMKKFVYGKGESEKNKSLRKRKR